MSGSGKAMGWLDHIAELRRRLLWTAATFALGTIVAFYYSPPLVAYLTRPAGGQLVFTRPGEAFGVHFQVAVVASLVLTVPVALYHLVAFILPGLERSERKWIWLTLPPVLLLFVGGVLFAYFVVVPMIYRFFMSYTSSTLRPMVSVGNYVSFVTSIVLPFGIVFELPVLVAVLTGVGLVTPAFLRRTRKYAILVVAILAAFLTPGTDPLSQLAMALPLVALYEMSIGVSVIIWKIRLRARTRREADLAEVA